MARTFRATHSLKAVIATFVPVNANWPAGCGTEGRTTPWYRQDCEATHSVAH